MVRSPQLDGLRAIAAISVVAFHSHLAGFNGGFIGVDIFFVLSGYLITSILVNEHQKTRRIDYLAFAVRRLNRLYPALVLMLLGFMVVVPFLPARADIIADMTATALYFNNYLIAFGFSHGYLAHTWSLASEMQFYLIWPPVVLAILALPHRQILFVLVIMFLAATLWRLDVLQSSGAIRAYFAMDTRVSGFIIGGMITFIRWRPSRSLANPLALLSVAVLAVCAAGFQQFSAFSMGPGAVLVEAAAALLILTLTGAPSGVGRLLASPVLVRIGQWSYGVYLWHYPISRIVNLSLEGAASFAVTLSLSLFLAAVSFELLEPKIARLWRLLQKNAATKRTT